MLNLDIDKKKIKSDHILADGEKLYFSTSIPAKIIFSLQNETIPLNDVTSNPAKVQEKYYKMISILKEIFYLHNEKDITDKVIDGLTFNQIAIVVKYVFEQIGNVKKKKPNGTK